MKRKLAIITARADDCEQSTTIQAITSTAMAGNIDVIVFTNLYNYHTDDKQLLFENNIYDLFDPSMFDAVILMTEPFADISVISGCIEKLKASNVPAVVIGNECGEFPIIKADDAADMENLTEHLITVHGLKTFDVLTGQEYIAVARERLNGCLRAFEKHDIAFDAENILYGDFWMDSGYLLGKQYAEKKRRMPDAVICTNEFMAYGLCEAFHEFGIRTPDDIAVAGYDNTDRWSFYYPFITSFSRDRKNIGYRAVKYLFPEIHEWHDDSERMIIGDTCGCGINQEFLRNRVIDKRIILENVYMNSESVFNEKLTLTRNLSEFMDVIEKFQYLLEHHTAFSLCLSRSWNQNLSDEQGRICCTITGSKKNDFVISDQSELYLPFCEAEKPYLHYLSPLAVQNRMFGYMILTFDHPDCYKISYRGWMKTTANALEMLRMKGDIHYLQQCQQTSELYDALTGFYRYDEFRSMLSALQGSMPEYSYLTAVSLVIPEISRFEHDDVTETDLTADAARAVRSACSKHDICCRKGTTIFVLRKKDKEKIFTEKSRLFVCHEIYARNTDKQFSVLCSSTDFCPTPEMLDTLCQTMEKETKNEVQRLMKMRSNLHFQEFYELHRNIHRFPGESLETEDICKKMCLSVGYFRNAYKRCFGFSYAQDRISARIDIACYLLSTSIMSIYSIAERVGYQNEKYLAKQFRDATGMTPMQYRELNGR